MKKYFYILAITTTLLAAPAQHVRAGTCDDLYTECTSTDCLDVVDACNVSLGSPECTKHNSCVEACNQYNDPNVCVKVNNDEVGLGYATCCAAGEPADENDLDCDDVDNTTTDDACPNECGLAEFDGCAEDNSEAGGSTDPAATTKTPTPTVTTGKTTLESPYGKKYAEDPKAVIAVVLQALLGIVGAATLLMFIWGGFRLIFSEGNEEKIGKSKAVLVWATVGLAVVMASYSVLSYTFNIIQKAATGGI